MRFIVSVWSSPFFICFFQHNLVVSARTSSAAAHSLVHVAAGDVNDNAPIFEVASRQVTVTEEDDSSLPRVIANVRNH